MKKKLAIIGSYIPRKCGIATFSSDLFRYVSNGRNEISIMAINDAETDYQYPKEVEFQIRQNYLKDYILAADYINSHGFLSVCLQHEFGIYGGNDGRFIIHLMRRLNIPVFTTLHTILDQPSKSQKMVLQEIAHLSSKIIVMSEKGKLMMQEIYEIPSEKIEVIGHGIHDTEAFDTKCYKKELGIENNKVLLTFGLLSKNKGIETVIKALPKILEKHPNVVYVVVGSTHPQVLKTEGESYRNELLRLVHKLNLDQNVIFIDRYVPNEELFGFLKSSDIYAIPYLSQKQITSGTLVYAMGTKNAIVSTPFWHAEEALAEDRGVLFDFNNDSEFSQIVIDLLNDNEKLEYYQSRASDYANNYLWPNIGKQYATLLQKVKTPAEPVFDITKISGSENVFPELNLNHITNLTDDTGLLQHARYHIPDRNHGYCLDDNARALLLTTLLQKKLGSNEEVNRLFSIYFSFVDYSYNPESQRFRNFMSYDRKWLNDVGSEDSQGRTIWALGNVLASTHNSNIIEYTESLFHKGLSIIPHLKHPRALSYALLGLSEYLSVYAHHSQVLNILKDESNRLYSFFEKTMENPDWPWFDHYVTYGNNRIAEAFLRASIVLKDDKIQNAGLLLLDWLIHHQFEDNIFVPIGNDGWLSPESKAKYDQQPLEAYGMIDACLAAYKTTGAQTYIGYAKIAFDWFLGDNSHGISLYDFSTGGCRDGLHSQGINKNQGAESTLAFLSSLLRMKLHL